MRVDGVRTLVTTPVHSWIRAGDRYADRLGWVGPGRGLGSERRVGRLRQLGPERFVTDLCVDPDGWPDGDAVQPQRGATDFHRPGVIANTDLLFSGG